MLHNTFPPRRIKPLNTKIADQHAYTRRYHQSPCTSGVQDPDFGVQSCRIFGLFWIWIGYRFPFNRIRIRIIQMK